MNENKENAAAMEAAVQSEQSIQDANFASNNDQEGQNSNNSEQKYTDVEQNYVNDECTSIDSEQKMQNNNELMKLEMNEVIESMKSEIEAKRSAWKKNIEEEMEVLRNSMVGKIATEQAELERMLAEEMEEKRKEAEKEIREALLKAERRQRQEDEEAQRVLAERKSKGEASIDMELKARFKTKLEEMDGYFSNLAKERLARCETDILQRMESFEKEMALLREGACRELEREKSSLDKELASRRQKCDDELKQKREDAAAEIIAKRAVFQEEQNNFLLDKKSFKEKIAKAMEICRLKEATAEEESRKAEEAKAEAENAKRNAEAASRRYAALEKRCKERSEKIDEELEERLAGEREGFARRLDDARQSYSRLVEELRKKSNEEDLFKALEAKLGGRDPEQVLAELNAREESIRLLREELQNRPTEQMRVESDMLRSKSDTLEREVAKLRDALDKSMAGSIENTRLKNQLSQAEDAIRTSETRIQSLEADNAKLSSDLKRFITANQSPEEVESRIRDITSSPAIHRNKFIFPEEDDPCNRNELEWLGKVEEQCREYGIDFPRRILKAFHTSLKIADWSPLTVLAGVSGTGKSELPRLYAHFGGMACLNVPVQPNWDCQESWLGFFNSIDNKFDAQPALRFIDQTQQPHDAEHQHSLGNMMSVILLDEMNLAHVELYFAEFLSKLEQRRGLAKGGVPRLDVKLGAGMPPYQIPLGRNLLWVGTMNQDETTKSLSDKVLDRSTVIHFPRPDQFIRRLKESSLNARNRSVLLPYKQWDRWIKRETDFTEEQIKPYKGCVEEINRCLSKVGRAIGHRVWQAMEYYMANYPDVIARRDDETELKKAMNTAFEDQLVQKIMPKLRGIDTEGDARHNCLDPIRRLLDDPKFDLHLGEDFEGACHYGYGQFIWNSALYISQGEKQDK